MYHLCTTAAFQTIYQKRKILDIRLNIKDFPSVGVTRFELATTRPPDAYSNRAELHPVAFRSANIVYFSQIVTFLQDFFSNFVLNETIRTSHSGILRVPGQRLRRLRNALCRRFHNRGLHTRICFGIRHPRPGQGCRDPGHRP